jgi:pyrimidine-nucleoside phosphorylase
MNIIDIIEKKKTKRSLTQDEIGFFVRGVVSGEIADYQTAALLMAICLNGMDESETFYLTDAMKSSGDVLELRGVKGHKVDKHSTGGVGDSTTFVVAPIAAALNLTVAKMSGRGLGFTGGTLDKLEAIEGLSVSLTAKQFEKQAEDIGIVIAGQSKNLCPADKILYALRDVTATVDSIPLIASSIMSKKLCAATDILVLDVKVGDGALLPNYEATRELARLMVEMGRRAGKKTAAVLTSMDEPLDDYIGNLLEVLGALEVLRGAKNNLYQVSKTLVKEMLMLSGNFDEKTADEAIERAIASGAAFQKFEQMVLAQGAKSLELPRAKHYEIAVQSKTSGYVSKIRTRELGRLVMLMGGGRLKKDDKIDATVGLKILKRTGDYVRAGEPLLFAYANTEEQLALAKIAADLFEFSENPVQKPKLVYETIR